MCQENPKLKVSGSKYSFQDVGNSKQAEATLKITDKIPLFNDFRTARTRDTNSDRNHETVTHTDGSLSGTSCSGMLHN